MPKSVDQLIKVLSNSIDGGNLSEVNFSMFSGETDKDQETIRNLENIWVMFQEYVSQVENVGSGKHFETISPSGDDDHLSHTLLSVKNQIFEKNKSLEELFMRFQGIMNTLPDALFSINEKGKILSCNKAAKDILGYEEEELLGNNINMIMPDPYHSKHDGFLRAYKKTGQKSVIGARREVIAKRKDGSTFPVLLAVGELQTKEGPVFTGIIQDITKQKVAEEEIKERNATLEEKSWIEGHIANILKISQNADDMMSMTQSILSEMAKFIEIGQGAFYIREEGGENSYKDSLKLYGSYAFRHRKNISSIIHFGEGLVGQCAFEKQPIVLSNVPQEYSQIGSALGEAAPLNVFVQPILFEEEILGAIELLSFKVFSEKELRLIEQIAVNLGTVINTMIGKVRTEKLLENSEKLSQELQEQQKITEAANKELEAKTNRLEESEKALKIQQEDLKVANEQLEEKSRRVEHQKKKIEASYAELTTAKKDIEKSSKYKSQFLSNMSHELRTPLNSLLLLSKKLRDNDEGNLTQEQTEMAECIHSGGKDLLHLINDILDLSKVEAGMLSIEKESIDLKSFIEGVSKKFKHTAQDKGIEFKIENEPGAHNHIIGDAFRLEQVIKNLLSNAFKFTSKGSVTLKVHHPENLIKFKNMDLNMQNCIAVSVADTGIGIPESKQSEIFEAFKQADGSTSRQFGGTGLGLSITVELLKLMGGEIQVSSRENEGSTFTCYLPLDSKRAEQALNNDKASPSHSPALENRDTFGGGKKINYVDDLKNAVELVRSENNLDHLKILLVEDSELLKSSIVEKLEGEKTAVKAVSTASEVLSSMKQEDYNCLILDYHLEDTSAAGVLKKISLDSALKCPPVIMNSARDFTQDELDEILIYTDKIVIKAGISSPVTPRNHVPLTESNPQKTSSLNDSILKGRSILVVDDDMRNTLALTTTLKAYGLDITIADNGELALQRLAENDNIDAVLMDIMMPVMDGYEAMEAIRKGETNHKDVPIIALTASTMPETKERSLSAGANDFLTKPVDLDLLIPMLKQCLKEA